MNTSINEIQIELQSLIQTQNMSVGAIACLDEYTNSFTHEV